MDEAAMTDEPASPSSSVSTSSSSASRQRPAAKSNSASSLVEKKGPFGSFRFTLPRTKKNKTVPNDDSTPTNPRPPKKLKKEKSFLRSLTSRKSTSAIGKEKDGKTTSSMASTLVRKISFVRKTKGDKKVTRESERSETSPATSHEEIEVGTNGAGASWPLSPMELDPANAATTTTPAVVTTTTTSIITKATSTATATAIATKATITTAAAAVAVTIATTATTDADGDFGVAGGVEPAIRGTDQWASIAVASDPLLGPPAERAHLVDTGTSTGTGTVAATSPRAAANQAGSPLTALSVSEHTSKLRAAWMSLPGSAEAAGTGAEAALAKSATKTTAKTAREQILSITAPAWESQQREKRRRDAKTVGADTSDVEPGTSHSAEFLTPKGSPDADEYIEHVATKSALPLTPASKAVPVELAPTTAKSSASVTESATSSPSKSVPESVEAGSATATQPTPASPTSVTDALPPPLTSAAPTLAPSEDILARPESQQHLEPGDLEETFGVAANAAVEDLMAEARAKLSQSLGVSTPSASPSVQQGGGGGGGEKREHLYKILVIGELGTGKTSIIKRYVHQFFSQHYRATIGVDFALKVLNWDANTIIRLQLWDIAGQERFGNMTRVYYKEAVAAFVVFDVTRQATFDAVLKWKQDLDSKVQLPDGSAIPCILLANKCDLQKEGLVNYPGKMDEYCKDRGFAGWFEISAKENINIEEAARLLVTKILANEHVGAQGEAARDADTLHLGSNASQDESRSRCSC